MIALGLFGHHVGRKLGSLLYRGVIVLRSFWLHFGILFGLISGPLSEIMLGPGLDNFGIDLGWVWIFVGGKPVGARNSGAIACYWPVGQY